MDVVNVSLPVQWGSDIIDESHDFSAAIWSLGSVQLNPNQPVMPLSYCPVQQLHATTGPAALRARSGPAEQDYGKFPFAPYRSW